MQANEKMKILITGRGGSGSWQIRGEQIGNALGALVQTNADTQAINWADVIVVVKRIPGDLLARIRASSKPWVYDIVDAYPQPEAGAWSQQQAKHWVQTTIAGIEPTAVIWPTAAMQACAPYIRGAVINHHHRPGIKRNPIREQIKTVGYEGAAQYLGEWKPALEKACKTVGAEFVVNPPHLADLDVVVAVRGRAHHGWVQENFKSNVKLANAQGNGTPIICQMDKGYTEQGFMDAPVAWIREPEQIGTWLKALAPYEMRRDMSQRLLQRAYSVEDAAKDYLKLLESVCRAIPA